MPGRNPDPRGYYALLRVSPEASRQEIGRAFRALMRRRHPDVGHSGAGVADAAGADAGLPDDNVDVRAILDAFTVLRDPRTRADYDAGASQAVGQAGTDHAGTDSAGTDLPVPAAATSRCGSSGAGIRSCACSPCAGNPEHLAGETPPRRPLTRTEAALTCPITSPTPRGGDRP